MTRDEAREVAKVLLAYAEGKTIQVKDKFYFEGGWEDNLDPLFNFASTYYRIKPEPKVIWLAEDGTIFTEEKHAKDYQGTYKIACKKYVEVVE